MERALLQALAARYPATAPASDGAWDPEDGAAHNAGYAAGMREVYLSHPGDPDVAALFADALMNLTPWALWDIATGNPAEGAATLEAKAVLEQALAGRDGRAHPGVLHMYIHLMEMSARPEDALPAGDLLGVQDPPMADWLEGFVAMRLHVLIRFGRWAEILAAPLPADPDLYLVTTAMTHYAKGVAHAATGQVGQAAGEQARFAAAVARVPRTRTIFNNTCQDILAVAGAMLDGEVEYRRGNYDEAFRLLRRAVELDDGLPYDEPWGWMQPARHAYGALLLEQGLVAEAEAVYRADLGLDDTLARACQHPGNVWSLHGYHECLIRLGKAEEAGIVMQQLKIAAARADVPIRASCYCRPAAVAD